MMVPEPTAQTSLAPLPQTAFSNPAPLETLDHQLPFQRRRVPLLPTAQTSLAPVPHTLRRSSVVPPQVLDQVLPFQWEIRPLVPTAHTSFAAAPQTPRSQVTVLETVQAEPSQCRTPSAPTAQTSLAPLPQTEWRSPVGRLEVRDHALPFHRRIAP